MSRETWYRCILIGFILSFGIAAYITSSSSEDAKSDINIAPIAAPTNKYYIEDGDTIAELLSVEATYTNIWTKKKYGKEDEKTVSGIVRHLAPDTETLTNFLFTEKVNDKDYYAYYDNSNGNLYIRASVEERKESLKSEIKSDISSTGVDFVTIFLARLDKYSKKLDYYDTSIRKEIVTFQTKNFPRARKEYFEHVKEKVWEKNIEVKMSGKHITFIGYMFADNKVKKDTYKEIVEELRNLRFNRVSFQWYDGSDTTYWDIDSKDDDEI